MEDTITTETEHHISLGRLTGVPESEARELFRTFEPSKLRDEIDPILMDSSRLVGLLQRNSSILRFFNREVPVLEDKVQDVYEKYPECLILTNMTNLFGGVDIVKSHTDLVSKLAGKPGMSFEDLSRQMIPDQFQIGIDNPLAIATFAAFAPKDERKKYSYHDLPNFIGIMRDHEFSHIMENTPDLTVYDTLEERLEGYINMLTINHKDALEHIGKTERIDISRLQEIKEDDPDRFRYIYRQAGLYLAQNQLYSILTDRKNNGKNNVFKANGDPLIHLGPIKTDLAQCPAAPLVSLWYETYGNALKDNKESVLEAIKTLSN